MNRELRQICNLFNTSLRLVPRTPSLSPAPPSSVPPKPPTARWSTQSLAVTSFPQALRHHTLHIIGPTIMGVNKTAPWTTQILPPTETHVRPLRGGEDVFVERLVYVFFFHHVVFHVIEFVTNVKFNGFASPQKKYIISTNRILFIFVLDQR